MNKVILIGRLTKDPEVRTTPNGVSVCQFSLAVDRRFASKNDGQQTADFINCVAWRNTADFLGKYFQKGSKVVLTGSIQTRMYEKDGQRRYITEVVAEDIEFGESKKNSSSSGSYDDIPAPTEPSQGRGEYFTLDESDSGMPF